MRLVFLGAPGVGKGTQARRLEEEYGWTVIATGDLLRQAIAEDTPLGQQAKAYIQRGELVPDTLVNQIVSERLQGLEHFILDGYPRNLAQAEMLESILALPLDAVIYFELGEEDLIARLSGRRVCPQCGAVYHVLSNPSKRGDQCDRCSAVLVTREDDRPETVRHRLKVYQEQTAPLIDYYRQRSLLRVVSAEGTPDAVYRRLLETLRAT